MRIRTFKETDTDFVVKLWQEVFPDDPLHNAPAIVIRQKLQCQPELFFVGELGGVIVGTVLSGYDGHRRKGLGTQLIRHAEKALSALGCAKINLQVRSTNAAVAAFYKSLGYQVEERISMGKRI